MLNGLREGERANCVRLSTICEATQAGSVSHTCPCGRLSENTDRALHLSHATPQEGPLRHLLIMQTLFSEFICCVLLRSVCVAQTFLPTSNSGVKCTGSLFGVYNTWYLQTLSECRLSRGYCVCSVRYSFIHSLMVQGCGGNTPDYLLRGIW